ncbi:MAG: hypothetical protein SGPRY_007160, partial [Prymnesium sp.]
MHDEGKDVKTKQLSLCPNTEGTELATVLVDLQALNALRRAYQEINGTRLRIHAQHAMLNDPLSIDKRVDSIQVGISVLGLPEQLSKPAPLVRKPATKQLLNHLFTHSTAAGSNDLAKLSELLASLSEQQQGVALNIYGVDTTKKHKLPNEKILLGEVFVPIQEAKGAVGEADLINVSRDIAVPSAERNRDRSASKGAGTLTFSLRINDALHWMTPKKVSQKKSSASDAGEKELQGKPDGVAVQSKDAKGVEITSPSKANVQKLKSALAQDGTPADSLTVALGMLPTAMLPSPLAARQR